MAEGTTDDLSLDALPSPPRPESEAETPGKGNRGVVSNDCKECNEDEPISPQEGLESSTMGIEENENYRDDNEPIMETLKGDSYLADDNSTSCDSVLKEITHPPEEWGFNRLLLKISKALTNDDLDYMKQMYKGEIGRKDLENIVKPTQLFDIMQKRTCLSPVNLLQLQCLLWDLRKTDLLKLVIDYAQRTKNVVYMHPASDQPVNGYKHIKFHILGKDFKKMTLDELWHIRSVVSNILEILPKYVLIDGVEPTESVTLTLLLQDKHADVLQRKLKDHSSDLIMFVYVGIDKITLNNEEHVVSESDLGCISDSSDEELKQVSIYRRYQEAKNLVSTLELEINSLETKLMILEADIETRKGCAVPKTLKEYTENVSETSTSGEHEPEQQNIVSAVENFSKTLRQTSEAGYDKQLLLKLLQAHVVIIATRCYHELSVGISKQHQQVQEQLSGIAIHKARNEVMRYLQGGTDDEPAEIKALRDISKKLRSSEKERLLKKYIVTKDEGDAIKEGSVPFLLIILQKELERNDNAVAATEFIQQCLLDIDRTDLITEFHVERLRYEQGGKRTRKYIRYVDSKAVSTQTEEQDERIDKEEQEDTSNDIKRLIKDVEVIKKALLEASSLENLANMKREYNNLLYNSTK